MTAQNNDIFEEDISLSVADETDRNKSLEKTHKITMIENQIESNTTLSEEDRDLLFQAIQEWADGVFDTHEADTE